MRDCLLRRQTERHPTCRWPSTLSSAGDDHQRDVFCEEHIMPIGFLTAADRVRLNRFPEQIPHEDLSAFFLLSEADQRAINQQHSEAHTRLGFALQLCALRYLGFAPDDLMTAPTVAVEYVAQQLGVAPRA